MSSTQQASAALRDLIAGLFDSFVKDGERRLADFLTEIEGDLAEVWTVPVERQERFLRRMELQMLGLLELQRIETVQATRQVVAHTVILAIRTLFRFITPIP